jgi:hypothetical protein
MLLKIHKYVPNEPVVTVDMLHFASVDCPIPKGFDIASSEFNPQRKSFCLVAHPGVTMVDGFMGLALARPMTLVCPPP